MMQTHKTDAVEGPPRIDDVLPAAALPGGEVELVGEGLGPGAFSSPRVKVSGVEAHISMSRAQALHFRVPETASTGLIEVEASTGSANAVPLRVAHQLADELHPVANPVVSRTGMIYTTISGKRGKQTPVSVVRIGPDGHKIPFVTGILNASGLAISPDDDLYVTSRAEGCVYLVNQGGDWSIFAEGLGVATGAVFDADGNLYVGDRSGTIFKINPRKEIFVHATLESSVSAYHLAVDREGALFVTAPSLSSNEAIWRIDPKGGDKRPWFRGLGRPQGLAFASDGSLYVAASLHGQRGLVCVTPEGKASLVLSGENLVGVAFSPLGSTILTTQDSVYEVDLGIEALDLY